MTKNYFNSLRPIRTDIDFYGDTNPDLIPCFAGSEKKIEQLSGYNFFNIFNVFYIHFIIIYCYDLQMPHFNYKKTC